MFSRWMYGHTSSSVQFDIGKTRMLSRLLRRVVEIPELGALRFGSH